MGTSKTFIEKLESGKDLLHRSSKLITDFTGIDEENLERFPRKRCAHDGSPANHTGALRLQGQPTSNLEIVLHFLVHVIVISRN